MDCAIHPNPSEFAASQLLDGRELRLFEHDRKHVAGLVVRILIGLRRAGVPRVLRDPLDAMPIAKGEIAEAGAFGAIRRQSQSRRVVAVAAAHRTMRTDHTRYTRTRTRG